MKQPDGIAHTWLGIRYKKTPWDSITNVSRIYMGLRGTVLWITCDKAKPLQPTKDGVLPDSWSISYLWMKGRYFTLLDQKDVVGYIEEIYGPLDFDCLLLEK